MCRASRRQSLAHQDSGTLKGVGVYIILILTARFRIIVQKSSTHISLRPELESLLFIGRTVSRYRILEKLGEGGMGMVFKAEDTKLDREVAIKFLPRQIAASDEEKKRFETEAKAAASLNHANIATIYNIEEVDGETFIVMEYVKGHELKDKIDDGPLPIEHTRNFAIQIAQGLQIAHEAGIVHRDIKSSNVMLTDRSEVKIMDFGLAKRGGQTKLTKEGTTLGTVAYMSPEQTRGDAVDQRSDIFSLGVVIYEMLTGKLPFRGDYDQAVIYSILNEHPKPATTIRTGIPMELEHIVSKCLKKNASARYQSADELMVDLKSIQMEGTSKSQATPGVIKKHRLSMVFSFLGVAAIVVLLAACGVYWLKPDRPIDL